MLTDATRAACGKAADTLTAHPEWWCQGSPEDDSPMSVGCLAHQVGEAGSGPYLEAELYRECGGAEHIFHWNDAPGRKVAEVIAALRHMSEHGEVVLP